MDAKTIADYIIKIGTENTSNGSWCMDVDELANVFGISEDTVLSLADEIVNELNSREEVAELEFYDNCFDLMFWLSYCSDWDGTLDWGCMY